MPREERDSRIHVVSVEHTGTHTLCEIVRCDKNDHADPEIFNEPEKYRDKIIFVPLRDPKVTWKSWVKRLPDPDKEIAGTDSKSKLLKETFGCQAAYEAKAHMFIGRWLTLDRFIHEYNPHIVPIDKLTNSHVIHSGRLFGDPAVWERMFEAYPWKPEFDFIYELDFIKEHYAPGP